MRLKKQKGDDWMSRVGFKVCRHAKCEQEQPLPISEFNRNKKAKDGLQSWCRTCQNEYEKNRQEQQAREAGHRAYEERLIKQEEIEDAIDLFKSCRSRIHSCKYGIGIYKDVDCDWDDPYKFLKDILTIKENKPLVLSRRTIESPWDTLWSDWKSQRKKYLTTNNPYDEPELDRIKGEKSPYRIGNIGCSSNEWNRERAKPITPLRIRLFKEGQLIQERHFAEITKAMNWIKSETDSKCGWKKVRGSIDKGAIPLMNGYEFKAYSLDSMMEEFRMEEDSV